MEKYVGIYSNDYETWIEPIYALNMTRAYDDNLRNDANLIVLTEEEAKGIARGILRTPAPFYGIQADKYSSWLETSNARTKIEAYDDLERNNAELIVMDRNEAIDIATKMRVI